MVCPSYITSGIPGALGCFGMLGMLLMLEKEEEGSFRLMLCNINFHQILFNCQFINSKACPLECLECSACMERVREQRRTNRRTCFGRQTPSLSSPQRRVFSAFDSVQLVLDKLSNSTKPELSTLLLTLCPL